MINDNLGKCKCLFIAKCPRLDFQINFETFISISKSAHHH